jgi:hypothetical protein
MDLLSLLRTLGALGLVLGLLAGALWAVRRYDLNLPGRTSTARRKRIELVERVAIDAKRSIALIRRDGCEHLILTGPDGDVVIETGIAASAELPLPASFPSMVDRAPAKRVRRPRWNPAVVREALRG